MTVTTMIICSLCLASGGFAYLTLECLRVSLSLSQAMLPSPGTFHALIRLALRDASMAPMTGVSFAAQGYW